MITATIIFLALLVILILWIVDGIGSGRMELVRREPPLGSRLKVKLHQSRTRLAATQAKNEIKTTSARLRRQLDREMRKGFRDPNG